jgi:hypothetical protein
MTENDDKSVQLYLNFEDPGSKDILIDQLYKRIAFLESENKRLNHILNTKTVSLTHPIDICDEPLSKKQIHDSKLISKQSSIEEKIACFRDYFKGREDVYALRGIDRTGKSAYFTQREGLGKKDGKYIWGENIPLKNEIFELHLQEKTKPVTIGLYPLLLDETCWFLAIDFDKKGWMEDTTSFLKTCVSVKPSPHSNHFPTMRQ